MKRCIYLKNKTQVWTDLSENLRKNYNILPVMWVGGDKNLVKEDIIYYSHRSAFLLENPVSIESEALGLELTEIAFLSKKINQYFQLMNRWTVYPEKVAYENKLEYFFKSYEIWKKIDKKLNFDLVICPTIPHRLYDYSLYLYCKFKKKKIVMGNATTDLYFDEKDNKYRNIFFYQDSIDKIEFSKITLNNLYIEENFKKYKDKIKSELATYVLENTRKNRLNFPNLFFKYFSVFIYLKFFLYKVLNLNSRSNLLKFDNFMRKHNMPKLASKADVLLDNYIKRKNFLDGFKYFNKNCQRLSTYKDKKFIVFFAGKTPERSNNPDGDFYFNELTTIDLILGKLPEDFLLIYREHPSIELRSIFISEKNKDFYKSLKKLSNRIIFASDKDDRIQIIKKSQAVCNLSGTPPWEAAVLGIPSFNFGNNWYNELDEIFKIQTIDDLEHFFTTKITSKVDQKKINDFAEKVINNGCEYELREINSSMENYNYVIDQHSKLLNEAIYKI